ncbi:MAG: hypothetical protein WKI04_18560 [Ferruginibacter sp.]
MGSASHEMLREYFSYIKQQEDNVWIATFADVTKYMRERMHAVVKTTATDGKIMVDLTHSLDTSMYDIPLTLKTYVPAGWKEVVVKQRGKTQAARSIKDENGAFVLYQLQPNKGIAELSIEGF